MPRPRFLTVIGWLFIVVGAAGLLNDWWPLLTADRAARLAQFQADGWTDFGPAWLTRALAIVGGIGLLARRRWSRWLLGAWMLFHVATSLLHSWPEVAAHLAIFTPITILLFSPRATRYFAATSAGG